MNPFPILIGVVYVAVPVYILILATRLVRAVEKIADKMGEYLQG